MKTRWDAAFIVRAVNSHEELLHIVKDWIEFRVARGMDQEETEELMKAIAQAEGKLSYLKMTDHQMIT